jgi:predicted nucleic acid-binding protein
VSHIIFLDSGPLGLITHPQYGSAEVVEATDWLSRSIFAGKRVIVPAIVYYELKRELLRARKSVGLSRLDAFVNSTPDRYLPLSDEALRLTADLWARSRQMGKLTADSKSIDIDVIIAAQALSIGADASDLVIATTNPKHLLQFVIAKHWSEIVA